MGAGLGGWSKLTSDMPGVGEQAWERAFQAEEAVSAKAWRSHPEVIVGSRVNKREVRSEGSWSPAHIEPWGP